MLTSITLQNFKGIGDPVTIPIRPLTIMFGKNSAGKSTVVQALHYAREVLLNNNPNADLSELGGSSVNLGGFESIVHNHDTSLKVRIRLDFDIEAEMGELEEKMDLYEADPDNPDDFLDLNPVSSVEITVTWSDARQTAIVTRYETSLFGLPADLIETSADGRDWKRYFNSNHIFFRYPVTREVDTDEPCWHAYIPIEGKLTPSYGLPGLLPNNFDHFVSDGKVAELLTSPFLILERLLREFRYIGPIREMPPRNFSPNFTENVGDWASGIAAWSKLYADDLGLVDTVSEWLGQDGLGTGYVLEKELFRELPLDSKLSLALQSDSAFDEIENTSTEIAKYQIRKRLYIKDEKTGLKMLPHDIGVGISQVVPIVVAAESTIMGLIAMEQPELHLHPAVQAELGDLMIVSMNGHGNTLLIETHSEHLILRILRRVREAREGEAQYPAAEDLGPAHISLVYVDSSQAGTFFLQIPITAEGDLENNVPGGFFAERAKELF